MVRPCYVCHSYAARSLAVQLKKQKRLKRLLTERQVVGSERETSNRTLTAASSGGNPNDFSGKHGGVWAGYINDLHISFRARMTADAWRPGTAPLPPLAEDRPSLPDIEEKTVIDDGPSIYTAHDSCSGGVASSFLFLLTG